MDAVTLIQTRCCRGVIIGERLDLGGRDRVGAVVVAMIVTRNSTKQRAVLLGRCVRKEGAGVAGYLLHTSGGFQYGVESHVPDGRGVTVLEVGGGRQSGGGMQEDGSLPDVGCCWWLCAALVDLVG